MPHFEHNALTLLLLQIAVIVSLSRLLMVGARRLGQPLVIAEVVAGIVLGPSLLGWVAPGAMDFLFPSTSLPVLKMLSQVGLVLFMFLVGLELDPRLMKGRAKASVAISHASIAVPFALGALLAWLIYERYASPGVGRLPFVLFMGIAMSITAFPVLARILSERHLLDTRLGAVAIACAAVDDVTAWCLLALVVAVARLDSLAGFGWTVGLTLTFIALVLFGLRPLLRRFAQRMHGSGKLPRAALAATLVMLLLSAVVTELIGIHALFGAFLFGVAMPKDKGFGAALAEKFETVAVTLLLPLFFAFSGLRTQLGLLSSPLDWAMTVLIIVLATAGKFGGSAIAARATGMGWREAKAIGILMNTRGLVELVVLNIGYDLGVINSTVFTMLVLMALATTFATSPLIRRVYPDSELVKERVNAASAAGGGHEPKGLLICVSVPKSGPGLAVVTAALRDASGGAEATALHLYAPTDRPSVEQRNSERSEAETPLGPLLSHARALAQRVRPLTFASSEPADDICRTAEAKQASLVLLAASEPPWSPNATTIAAVTARSLAPVAVLVDRGLVHVDRVVIALTGEPTDAPALVLARHLGPSRPRPMRLDELPQQLASTDLVLVGAGPGAARLEPMLEGTKASVLWVHPAKSRGLTEDVTALAPSRTVA